MSRSYVYKIIHLLIWIQFLHSSCDGQACSVLDDQSVIILDITESLGEDFSQSTFPVELPIIGDSSSIELKISEEGSHLFRIEGKSLKLTRSLDRDKEELSTIRFELNCKDVTTMLERSIPVIVRIEDRNDNPPVFLNSPYKISIPENTPVGIPVFRNILAKDIDAGVNGQVIYEITEARPPTTNTFDIRFPHQGLLFLNKPLDYEQINMFELTILATDLSIQNSDRLNATTTITISIEDIDDKDPVFDTAVKPKPCKEQTRVCQDAFEYHSSIMEGRLEGVLNIYPTRIHAIDPDSLNYPINYSFMSGTPSSFRNYFEIDNRNAVIRQVKSVKLSEVEYFQIIIQAEEQSERKGKRTAKVLISVEGVDNSPPNLSAESYSGTVEERSPVGTTVMRDDGSGQPLKLTVSDPDYGPGDKIPEYIFELTTTNFKVTQNGTLIVSNPNLDRDPPNLAVLAFQAIAREANGGAASTPLSLTVALKDINDNAPRIPVYPTITIPAGKERRILQRVKAIDRDDGQNARVRYSIVDSADGRFSIDPVTGDVVSESNLVAGEQYQLKVEAKDAGGLSGTGILDVVVSRGPNTNGPVFHKTRYTAAIPENTAYGEKILTLRATDPEGDVPYFSFEPTSDGTEAFEIDTLSGIVSLIAPLDRERKEQYEMFVKAEDSEGKFNIANLFIRVLDVNDEAPKFLELPYSFRVDEGKPNAFVGLVKAVDNDLGEAGSVSFELQKGEERFTVDPSTGEIFTKIALNYEKEQAHNIPVIAKDNVSDALSSTATVTVLVNDLNDEVPIFDPNEMRANVSEKAPKGSVVATVKAVDPDTQTEITYKMINVDPKFKIDPITGRVILVGELDYEEKNEYVLIIGTDENKGSLPNSKVTLTVKVDDMNDNTPVVSKYESVTIPRNAPIGSLVVVVDAADKDGTLPNNKITFSLKGDLATQYFEIDEISGEIKLKRSLKNAAAREILVTIKASDGGQPTLSDYSEFAVLLLEGTSKLPGNAIARSNGKVDKISLASFPRFSKERLDKNVREDHSVGNTILKIPLVNSSSSISCSIIEGNEEDVFNVYVSMEQNCVLQLQRNLDYEINNYYQLKLILHPSSVTLSDVINDKLQVLSRSQVNIKVLNINDNSPEFVFPKKPNYLNQNEILTFALQDTQPETSIIYISASDADRQGDIIFSLDPRTNRGNYFYFDSKKQTLKTRRTLTNIPSNLLPFNLTLMASDQPDADGIIKTSFLNVIIPIVEESHRRILVMNAPINIAEEMKEEILEIISDSSGFIANTENIIADFESQEEEEKMTHFYFHLLNSSSLMPVVLKDTENTMSKNEIAQRIMTIQGINSALVYSPVEVQQRKKENIIRNEEDKKEDKTVIKMGTSIIFGTLEYVFLVMAAIIILFAITASFVVCILWSRFNKKWNSGNKTVVLMPPFVERPPSVYTDGFSKEYEVQVLHMSVPLDEESMPEGNHVPPNHHYFLDNVSYISKAFTGHDGTSSEGGPSGRVSPGPAVFDPPSFQDYLNSSSTNDNVMFGRKIDRSPVETTTEL